MKYLKITKAGEVFLHEWLTYVIEHDDFSHGMADLLMILKKAQNTNGLFQLSKRVPHAYLLPLQGLRENGLIEEVEGGLLDNVEELIEKRWRKKEKEERDVNWRMGLGPPPSIFEGMEDEE